MGLDDILRDKVVRWASKNALSILLEAIENNEEKVLEFLHGLLKSHNIAWLPDDIEELSEQAVMQVATKGYQLLVDGLKLAFATQVKPEK